MIRAGEGDRIIGPYTGQLAESFAFPEFVAALGDLQGHLARPDYLVLNDARSRTVCVPFPAPDSGTVMVVVKGFPKPPRIQSEAYRRQGSKARRSFAMARFLRDHGVGSPFPLGFLERWDKRRLVESYFLSEYQAEAVEAHSEVIRLFSHPGTHGEGKRLLELIAGEVRGLHEAGVEHGDLGHQNILVHPTATGWKDVQFIDLNRARIRGKLSLRQRASDVSRLWCPHSVRPAFLRAYFDGREIPRSFLAWLRTHRVLLSIRKRTRVLRHPRRSRRREGAGRTRPSYPSERAL
jgi:tRNA A-37 threonylcarbamoyl transferase component Bud32